MDSSRTCTNCSATLSADARYCHACGQKVVTADSRRFVQLVRSSVEEITSINGRLLPTLGLLLARPGALAIAYRRGQWRRYLSPIGIFLLANVVFFLAPGVTDFNVTLRDQQALQPYSVLIRPWIDATVAASGTTFDEFAADYRLRASDIAKTMVIVHVPLLALVTLLLFPDRRRLYADHVVAALHFFAFLMLYFTATPFIVAPHLSAAATAVGADLNIWSVATSLQFVYVPPMLRRAFEVSWLRAIVSTLVFLPLLLGVHIVYRLLQLVIVLALLN